MKRDEVLTTAVIILIVALCSATYIHWSVTSRSIISENNFKHNGDVYKCEKVLDYARSIEEIDAKVLKLITK